SPGAHDRNPAWSPDGSQIAWLSDASGEYQLMLAASSGFAKPRSIALPSPAFFSAPDWSPDGKLILLKDNHLNLWTFDVAASRFSKIANDTYDDSGRDFDAVWSPDSRWVAYSKSLDSHMRAIFVHSLATGKAFQLTDGLADAISPAFDAGGKYLYFLASTNFGPSTSTLDMSSIDRPSNRAVYLAVLAASEPSPFLAERAGGGAGAGRGGGRGGAGAGPGRWAIAATDRPARGGDAGGGAGAAGALDLSRLETWVDPKAEWGEIFRETWRIEREYFYDPEMH